MLAPIELSETTLMGPIMPRASTWVPPQNSSEWGPARTTRTTSPYLSPKNDSAPMAWASARVATRVSTGSSVSTSALASSSTSASSRAGSLVVAEVEAQPVRGHQRALLADVVAQDLPQGGVEQVGAGVVPPNLCRGLVDGGQRVLAGEDLALTLARWAVRPGRAGTVS